MHINKCYPICLAALCLLFLPACSVSHKQASEAQHYGVDSARILVQDSTHYQRLLRASGQMELRLRHITLSAPDSLGRQHPQTITVAELKQTHRTSRHDTLTRQASQKIHLQSEVKEMQKESDTSARSNFRLEYWIVAIGGVCCFLYSVDLLFKKKR